MSEVHDAATSKRYLEALREVQADNERLRAHIQGMATKAQKTVDELGVPVSDEDESYREVCTAMQEIFMLMHGQHLAALTPTEKVRANEG